MRDNNWSEDTNWSQDTNWVRSSFCAADKPQCVEVRQAPEDGAVLVRDSKDPDGHELSFTETEWGAFLDGVKSGEFDLDEFESVTTAIPEPAPDAVPA